MDVRIYTINQFRTRHGYNNHFFLTSNVFQIYLHLTNIKNLLNQERLTTEYTAEPFVGQGFILSGIYSGR